jgi:hypothetical protein
MSAEIVTPEATLASATSPAAAAAFAISSALRSTSPRRVRHASSIFWSSERNPTVPKRASFGK